MRSGTLLNGFCHFQWFVSSFTLIVVAHWLLTAIEYWQRWCNGVKFEVYNGSCNIKYGISFEIKPFFVTAEGACVGLKLLL